jgi:hypothetical protein
MRNFARVLRESVKGLQGCEDYSKGLATDQTDKKTDQR